MKFICYFYELFQERGNSNIFDFFKKISLSPSPLYQPLDSTGEVELKRMYLTVDELGSDKICGRMFVTEDPSGYDTENDGILNKLKLNKGTNILSKNKNILHYIVYKYNETYILMLEYIPFNFGISAYVNYLNEKMELSSSDFFKYVQKMGSTFYKKIKENKDSKVKLLEIKPKKKVSISELKKYSYIEEAGPSLKEADLKWKLILFFDKNEKLSLGNLFKKFFKQEYLDKSIFTDNNISETFRVLNVGIYGEKKHINFLSNIIKYETEDRYKLETKEIHNKMFDYLQYNIENIIGKSGEE